MHQTLEDFIQAVRGANVRVSVAEAMEAYETVRLVGYGDREVLRDALSVTMAKTAEDKARFVDCFDRFFQADSFDDAPDMQHAVGETEAGGENAVDLDDAQTDKLVDMLLSGDRVGLMASMREAAREADISEMTLFTQRGVYLQRMMRKMGLDALDRRLFELERSGQAESPQAQRLKEARAYFLDQMKEFIQQQIQLYTGASGNQLREESLKDRKLAKIEVQDFERMQDIVRTVAKRLSNVHARRAKRALRGQLDVRKTLRSNMGFDGSLFDIRWKRTKVSRPRVVVICDVSRSVADYSRFLLLFLYSMTEVIDRIRTFTFCSDVAEVSQIFETSSVEEALFQAQAAAPIGSTDYGQVFRTLEKDFLEAFTPRTTVMILGDARNNYGDPETGILKLIQQRSRNVIWLNPEPTVDWGTGDSEMDAYRPFCHLIKECNTINQLEQALDQMLKLTMRAA